MDWKFGAVVAKPTRTVKQALRYWFPKRLTLKLPDRPRIHAWLWWNL